MALRFRPMQPKDIRECAEIIKAHPVIGPRYGRTKHELHSAWTLLIGREAMTTAVYEEVDGAAVRKCGVAVGLFVHEEFVRELKTPPLFWFGAEFVKRITSGRSPVLSDKEVREANSGEGLNLVVWEALPCLEFATRSDLFHLMIDAFREVHRGFRLKEMITSQAESVDRLKWAVDAGGLIWDPAKARYTNSPKKNAEDFVRKPHVVGITRELEFARLGSWVGTLFDYLPPRFGFSRSEQRMLLAALAGQSGTDEELAVALGVSLPTIKKMWLSVYRRMADVQPKQTRDSAPSGTSVHNSAPSGTSVRNSARSGVAVRDSARSATAVSESAQSGPTVSGSAPSGIAVRDSARSGTSVGHYSPSGTSERGKEKRRRLLTYLRDHPEELRPVSQKHLQHQPPVTKRIHRVQA